MLADMRGASGGAGKEKVNDMNAVRFIAMTTLALSVSACASVNTVVETATRAEPLTGAVIDPAAPQMERRSYDVQDVRIRIPNDLVVSEANGFYPLADIVWRGEPLGDRREQVANILRDAFIEGTEELTGDTPVVVTLTLRRFHSVTERTRYTVGGTHSIKFDLAVTDAETGVLLEGPRFIDADFAALGGQAAIQADQNGQGQKVRIHRHLSLLAAEELRPQVGEAILTGL